MIDFVGRAKKLERKIARSLEAAVGEFAGTPGRDPLEVIHEFLDRAEQEIHHVGRGRRAFPYTRVRLVVAVPAKDKSARARFEAVAAGPPSVADRLASRLESAGVPKVRPAVDVDFVGKAGASWDNPRFAVEFSREVVAPPSLPPPATVPTLRLAVVTGKASHRSYTFTGGRIDLGRRAEIFDARQRLIRTNHVVFLEDAHPANSSVSRRHAHVSYDAASREYRLMDDRSAHGTGVVRKGRTITVHAGARGVRLEDGDEILLGQAKVRVAIDNG